MARPSLLTAQLAYAVAADLAAGMFFEQACARHGITAETGRNWIRIAAGIDRREFTRGDDAPPRSEHEAACCAFSALVDDANARYEAGMLALLGQIARGTLLRTVTTEKFDAGGKSVGKTVRTETIPPDPMVIFRRLAQRFPDRYRGAELAVTLTDPGAAGRSDAEVAEQLGSDLRAYLQGVEDARPKRKRRAPRAKAEPEGAAPAP